MHCPGGNATYPIWRVLASSLGISSWTPLKPQNSNPNPLANQLLCIGSLTPPTPLIIPLRLPAFLESLMPLKKLMIDLCKMLQKQSEVFHTFLWHFFPSLKQNFIAYCSFKVSSRPDCIFEIHQLWQSGFSRVYSNCCCSCSFELEIIKIGQSSHTMLAVVFKLFLPPPPSKCQRPPLPTNTRTKVMLNVIRIGWFFNHKQFEEHKKQFWQTKMVNIFFNHKHLELNMK